MILNGETACCYTYNAANELTDEMSDQGEVDYAYDGRGNCIRKSIEDGYSTYFAYNSRNLIAGITSDDPAFTPNAFTYNALGQRISKTDSTGATYYVWDGLHILLEHDGAGTVTRRYTYGHEAIHGVGGLIDVEDSASGDHYFYHFDQVGGVRNLTTEAAAIDTTYEFSPFGRILGGTAGSAPNDFTFPATYVELPDAEQLRLSPTRAYGATAGRFWSRDWLRRGAGPSPYVLVAVDPVAGLDPSGLQKVGVGDAFRFEFRYYVAENCKNDPRWADPGKLLTDSLRDKVARIFRSAIPGGQLVFQWTAGKGRPGLAEWWSRGTRRSWDWLDCVSPLSLARWISEGMSGAAVPERVVIDVDINCCTNKGPVGQTPNMGSRVTVWPNRVLSVQNMPDVAPHGIHGDIDRDPAAKAQFENALANVLAYETGFHSIAGNLDYLHNPNRNAITLDDQPKIRAEHFKGLLPFSKETAREIRRELDLETTTPPWYRRRPW